MLDDPEGAEPREVRTHRRRSSPKAGVPRIRRLRILVATVVGMVADRMTHEEILRAYPDLEPEDIEEVLLFRISADRGSSSAARR